MYSVDYYSKRTGFILEGKKFSSFTGAMKYVKTVYFMDKAEGKDYLTRLMNMEEKENMRYGN